MPLESPADELRARLREAIPTAVKARDQLAIAALRSALSAIDNAEAADLGHAPPMQSGTIAGGVAGIGAGDVPRRELSAGEVVAVVHAEIAEYRTAAADYIQAGQSEHARRLRAQADVLARLLESGK